jgi:hypothetical protein
VRERVRRNACLGILVLLVGAASCGPPSVERQKLDPAKVDALRLELERASPEATPRSFPTPRKPGAAPARTAKQRRARAQAALPPGHAIDAIASLGRNDRYAFVLAAARDRKEPRGTTLWLLDLGEDPGRLLAAHDFGDASALAGGTVRIATTFELADDTGLPVLLADLRSSEGGKAVCGWWLSPERPRLVCAPASARPSSHRAWLDMLIESWDADAPSPSGRAPGVSGRVLVFAGGGWREADGFRCLGGKLEGALRDAETQPLGEWQRAAVGSRRAAALAADGRGESEAALELLRDALEIDGCDVENWRLVGRLELRSGDAAGAVPALAVAVALRPHGEAALVDLADALISLEANGESARNREAWEAARTALSSRKATQALVAAAKGDRPKDLARVLYERFLALTERSAPRLGAQRRHAREQIERAGAAVNPGSPGPSPTAAR